MARMIILGNSPPSKNPRTPGPKSGRNGTKPELKQNKTVVGIAAAVTIVVALVLIFQTVRGMGGPGGQDIAAMAASNEQPGAPNKMQPFGASAALPPGGAVPAVQPNGAGY